jgi:apoptosis-inducing factor 3
LSDAEDLGSDLATDIPLADLRDGGIKKGHIAGTKALLVRQGEEVFAIGATCTHLDGPLGSGLVIDGSVRCPWHHACFSLRSGAAVSAPAFEPLPRWEVAIKDGIIRVGGRIRAGSPPRDRQATRSADRFIIIGGGAAGFAAVNTLLRCAFSGEITMISEDTAPPYDRTLLSKDYLDGHFGDDRLPLSARDLFSHDREIVLQTKVTKIDPIARQVTLDNGRTLSYSKALLATGAAPKRPNFPGSGLSHVKLLRSLDDCRDILSAAQDAHHIAVIGGSFIGLEAAASLRDRGHSVSVIAPETEPMGRIFGPQLARLVAAVHQKHGVDWHVGRKVEEVTASTVRLDDGSILNAGLVVVGIGVVPRTELAEAAGIAVDDGVLVDEYLATNVPDVFAAGDIARWHDRYSDQRIRVEHWVVAERQGQIAALNMMGRRQSYAEVPFFWTKHFELSIQYVGHAATWDELQTTGDIANRDGLVRFIKGKQLMAVATVERDVVALEEERAWELAQGPRQADL